METDNDSPVEAFRRAEAAYLSSLDLNAQHRSVELRGLGVSGRLLEVGEGPTALMLHGGGGLGSGWATLIAHLDDMRLIAPDRPGFGLTDFIDHRQVDFRRMAVQFVDDVLDAVGLTSVNIIANSMGGLWSLWYALDRPNRVKCLALLGTPALILETSAPAGMRLLGVPGLNRLVMALEPASPRQVRTLWKRMGHDPERVCTPEMIELIVRLERLPSYKSAWLSLLEAVIPFGRPRESLRIGEEDLRAIQQEVLFIWGCDDPFGSLDVAGRADAATPHSRLETIGVGHLPWLDEPQACATAIREFFGKGVQT